MVKNMLFITCLLLVSLVPSCEFFLLTPFPAELPLLEAYTDISSQITSIYSEDRYKMIVIDNILCLTINTDSSSSAFLFDTADLSLKAEALGQFNNYFMRDVDGNMIVGDLKFNADFSTQQASGKEISHYGFSFATENYEVWCEYNNPPDLRIMVYDSAWGELENYTVTLDYDYNLEEVFYDSDGTTADSVYLVMLFRINSNNANRKDIYELVKIPLNYVYDSLVPQALVNTAGGAYPFNVTPVFVNIDESEFFHTRTGYVMKGYGDYYYYPYTDLGNGIKLAGSHNYQDPVIAIDVAGQYFYSFDTRLRKLYKYLVWW
jgi:hypothetical protein